VPTSLKPCPSRPRGRARIGVVVIVTLVVVVTLGVILFALHSRMGDENARAHRAYYGATALGLAQACEAEASAWIDAQLALPKDRQHSFLRQLYSDPTEDFWVASDDAPARPDDRYLDMLGEGLLPVTAQLAREMPGGAEVLRATFCFKDMHPIQDPGTEGFDPRDHARVVPDPHERFGALEFQAEVAYGRVGRGSRRGEPLVKRYISRRDVKVVNLLPPVVSRFTLFARGFRGPGGSREPFNAGVAGTENLRAWLGQTDFLRSQPLVLIHHPGDVKERLGYAGSHAEVARYLPHGPPFDHASLADPILTEPETPYRPDLHDRGWVFLGGGRSWPLNLQAGRVNLGANVDRVGPEFAARLTTESFLFHETYLTSTSGQFGSARSMRGWDPNRIPDGHGWRFAIWCNGIPAGTFQTDVYRQVYFGNYYSRAAHDQESRRPSLVRLFGDMQTSEVDGRGRPGRYLDRRSPTVVLGPVLRRHSVIAQVMQRDEDDFEATQAGTFPLNSRGRTIFPYRDPGGAEPLVRNLPYFYFPPEGGAPRGGRFRFYEPWMWRDRNPPRDMAKVHDRNPDPSGRRRPDYPEVGWSITEDLFRFNGEPRWNALRLFTSRVETDHYHRSYDWLVENAHPRRAEPQRHLHQTGLPGLRPFEGTVPDRAFFYGTEDPDTDLCYFASNLRLEQAERGGAPAVDPAFPEGFFQGALGGLRLHSPGAEAPDPKGSIPFQPSVPDMRAKATFVFQDQDAFEEVFLRGEPGRLAETVGVTVLREGGLDLEELGELEFDRGGMVIVPGPIRLPRVRKSEAARRRGEVLTFMSTGGDITLTGELVEASLIALGQGRTVRREPEAVTIRGNLVVDVLDFDTTGNSMFARRRTPMAVAPVSVEGGPDAYPRNVVEYDPALNVGVPATYRRNYEAFLSPAVAYWGVTE
jgi:hypothetical protein